ncbi:uncharacterized protein CCOS01_12314 [Colletotrichum costaricense]|uniref:ceramidase n=1 Tax=Colletotrichum costaricense TaxID=1209916 RepID=A0AAI9YPR0_9PEZI|nr:uncharacterized protein CCOS01_12314 [Colletotrichum costaricense]KAK1518057.1 hypothetical protein CCOS01_12314 [Colletotrichum costaricense]
MAAPSKVMLESGSDMDHSVIKPSKPFDPLQGTLHENHAAFQTMLTLKPDDIPIYKVDMGKPAEERYIELAKDLAPKIREVSPLFDEVIEATVPRGMSGFAKFTSRFTLRKVFDPEQTKEIKSIAEVAGIPVHQLMALNTFLDLMLGCTSGAALVKNDSKRKIGGGNPDHLMHFRTLEWGMDILRDILVIIEYVDTNNGSNEVIARSVTYAGFVGMLTGVRLLRHQIKVLFGLRESVPSMLRRIILKEDISFKNTKAYDTKDPNPREDSRKLAPITSIGKKLASSDASPCYLTLCDGREVVNILKDLYDGKIKTSSVFQIQCNHDPDHRRCCGRMTVRHGADPVQAKLMESEDWIEVSADRQNAFHDKWIEHVRAITNGNDITWAKQNSCCTGLELDAEASKSGEMTGVDEAKLREWIASYPTTNDSTHFMCIMDPLTGEIRWISREHGAKKATQGCNDQVVIGGEHLQRSFFSAFQERPSTISPSKRRPEEGSAVQHHNPNFMIEILKLPHSNDHKLPRRDFFPSQLLSKPDQKTAEMPASAPALALNQGPMTNEVLRGIFASDQDMYPAPLTWDRLRSWTTAAPELAICFYLSADAVENDDTQTLVGAVIALPILAPAWRDLLAGEVKEVDVDAGTMFPRDGAEHPEVGLHVFHVERFDVPEARGKVRGFAETSMQAVVAAAERKRWSIIGYSALTATPEGRRCFEKMGFEATGYEEFWVDDGRKGVQLVTITADTAPEKREVREAATVRGQARMLVKHLHPVTDA